MTDNETAIARNEQLTLSLKRMNTLANIAFMVIAVGLVIVLVVVSIGYTTTNSALRADNDAADVELRCRSTIVNKQAEAQAALAIEDAHNDSLTSRALVRIAFRQDFADLTDLLLASADNLDAKSDALDAATEERTQSVDTCQED